jgi:hypothetical protein
MNIAHVTNSESLGQGVSHFESNLLMDLWSLWPVVRQWHMTCKKMNCQSDIIQLLSCVPSNYNQSIEGMVEIKAVKNVLLKGTEGH